MCVLWTARTPHPWRTPSAVHSCCPQLLSDVRRIKRALIHHRSPTHIEAAALIAAQLAGLGYACAVRTAIGPDRASSRSSGSSCPFKNLRHVFVVVRDPEGGQQELIVDANFKEVRKQQQQHAHAHASI